MAAVLPLPSGDRGVLLELEEVEVALLQSLAHQMIEFISPADQSSEDPLAAMVTIDPLAQIPDDPALRRLLPDAFLDDEHSAGEFRRFTERDLRASKAAHAATVLADLSILTPDERTVSMTGDDVLVWLGFLTDTRLTLGTRLAISEENHEELATLPESDPRAGLYQVYDWLTFLQESIVQHVLDPA